MAQLTVHGYTAKALLIHQIHQNNAALLFKVSVLCSRNQLLQTHESLPLISAVSCHMMSAKICSVISNLLVTTLAYDETNQFEMNGLSLHPTQAPMIESVHSYIYRVRVETVMPTFTSVHGDFSTWFALGFSTVVLRIAGEDDVVKYIVLVSQYDEVQGRSRIFQEAWRRSLIPDYTYLVQSIGGSCLKLTIHFGHFHTQRGCLDSFWCSQIF